jgi:hypothetical protein
LNSGNISERSMLADPADHLEAALVGPAAGQADIHQRPQQGLPQPAACHRSRSSSDAPFDEHVDAGDASGALRGDAAVSIPSAAWSAREP